MSWSPRTMDGPPRVEAVAMPCPNHETQQLLLKLKPLFWRSAIGCTVSLAAPPVVHQDDPPGLILDVLGGRERGHDKLPASFVPALADRHNMVSPVRDELFVPVCVKGYAVKEDA